ncbi:CENPBD1 [Cordylochernes scorpioides]|uniref:CENPBD1 n=1 Tax=Cordylochernes scorpioides TaxID=51811 RepID=A0ABY6KDR8_9ARAC|nr:CENPBD1 [Cordylochernes scorpioides]
MKTPPLPFPSLDEKGDGGAVTSSLKNLGSVSLADRTLLETKLDIQRRFDKGEKAVKITKAVGLAATTVRTIRDRDGDKIREAAKFATSLDAKMMKHTRSALMIKIESLLSIWIENQVAERIPLKKAKCLFDDIKIHDDNANGSENETFEASQGWFERFKVRANLHSIALKGEAASADITVAERYPTELKTLIHEGGYDSKQVFNVDETGLFWKRLPDRTFTSKTEKSAPGFKTSKDRLTLLLGGNANGDFKFKPFLIYKSENPIAMKGCSKNLLPVHWRANKKAWMTTSLFKNWVTTCAIPEIKAYCIKENLNFKALVLVDNAPSHPVYVDELSENVKFVFFSTQLFS